MYANGTLSSKRQIWENFLAIEKVLIKENVLIPAFFSLFFLMYTAMTVTFCFHLIKTLSFLDVVGKKMSLYLVGGLCMELVRTQVRHKHSEPMKSHTVLDLVNQDDRRKL